MKIVKTLAAALLLGSVGFAAPAFAQTSVDVGGAAMMSNMTIAENAPNASNLTTLVAAVTAADLVETLAGPGPFTVFAPTNAAFDALPAGTVDGLLQPDQKDVLTHVLTYHVVPGTLTAADLQAQAEANGGMANLTTVSGDALTVEEQDGAWVVVDESGNVAKIETADVLQSNGVVHVIDTVLMPSM
jgi:uncharacterized surface protein with fasciclin (FAS1) repeats